MSTTHRAIPRTLSRAMPRAGLALGAVLVLGLSACGSTDPVGSDAAGVDQIDIIVPADPGGGWDQTGREMAKVLESEGLVDSASVTNVPGAGGTTGLAQMASTTEPNTLMVMGYVMLGAVELNQSSVSLDDVTPIAALTEEQEVVVVPADSPYETIQDLLDDVATRGKEVAIAGGSAGGTDHILAGLVYQAAGLSADDLNYVPYDGGGESVAALLGGKVDAGISGAGEYREQVKAGALRALAVSGEEPVEGYEGVQPLSEQGIDVVLTNWRGVVAPGSLDETETAALIEVVEELHGTEAWTEVLERNDWTDAYLVGEEFGDYIDEQVTAATETLQSIGLIG